MPFPDEPFAHRVEVVAARDGWPAEAATYVAFLRDAVPTAVAVDHIGSTSVPGLPAKDCLDLMVQVADLDEEQIVASLTERGLRLRPESWNHGEVTDGVSHRKLVFAGPEGGRPVNVHVRVAGGRNCRYALLFRDFLRADARRAGLVGSLQDQAGRDGHRHPSTTARSRRRCSRCSCSVPSAGRSGPGGACRRTRTDLPVLGVDGCKAGWVGVAPQRMEVRRPPVVAPTIADLVAAVRADHPGWRSSGSTSRSGSPTRLRTG